MFLRLTRLFTYDLWRSFNIRLNRVQIPAFDPSLWSGCVFFDLEPRFALFLGGSEVESTAYSEFAPGSAVGFKIAAFEPSPKSCSWSGACASWVWKPASRYVRFLPKFVTRVIRNRYVIQASRPVRHYPRLTFFILKPRTSPSYGFHLTSILRMSRPHSREKYSSSSLL